MTNGELNYWFRWYNRKYFGNRLKVAIKFSKMRKATLGLSVANDGEWDVIYLSRTLRPRSRAMFMILLHEMAHVSLPPSAKHGPRFEKEMLRLAKAGAFKGVW